MTLCTGKGCLLSEEDGQVVVPEVWEAHRPSRPTLQRSSPRVLRRRLLSRAGHVHREREVLISSCTARLAQGAIEYGDLQFWHADCAKEAGEEGVDAINWAFLDYTKSLASKDRTDVDDDGRDLALIAACGASIFAAANRIRARRQEE
jgi:hypothetical protein